jgi:hypothetical protein
VTAAELFLRLADHDGPGAHFEDRSYPQREVVAEASRPERGGPLRPLGDDDRVRLDPLLDR